MASVYDIELDQGSDAVIPFELYDASDTPLDLSGYTARMQIRPSVGSATISDELTTENGRLSIEGGTITASEKSGAFFLRETGCPKLMRALNARLTRRRQSEARLPLGEE